VSFAPQSTFAVNLRFPLDELPLEEVLAEPKLNGPIPTSFKEERHKFTLLRNIKKGPLLDVGCGQGNRFTFEQLGFSYVGCDVSFDSRQRDNTRPDVDLVADTHRLPLRDNCFAAINSTAVIEHLYFPLAAASEWLRVLKPEGLLVGSCSFLEGEHFNSQCHYTALGLFRTLRCAGFDVQYIYPGLTLWELHSGSIYFGMPFRNILGRLHRKMYLRLSEIKRKGSAREKLFANAAIVNFVATKPTKGTDQPS